MKNYAIFWIATLFIFSCTNAPEGDQAKVSEEQHAAAITGEVYNIDSSSSTVRFTGNGVGKNHPGRFKVTAGSVAADNTKVTGGEFTIDIRTLDLEQKGGVFDEKLRPHLLSPDFFDVNKYPLAKFEITGVKPYNTGGKDSSVVAGANYMISGNLTLKNVTKNLQFPAKVIVSPTVVQANGNFNIDRTQWGMNYGSDRSLGDKFISETVNIQVNIKARR